MDGQTLFARLRRSPKQRLAILLFAVPAIVIGLLAMHVLTASPGGESVEPVSHHLIASTTTSAAHSGDNGSAPTGDCAEPCGPTHDMVGMICALALLATVVFVMVALVLIRWAELRRLVNALAIKAAALAPPTPPSLLVLSISRT
jgi:hypothetical protein